MPVELSPTMLQDVPAFAMLHEAALDRLAAASTKIAAPADHTLLRAGERPEHLLVLCSGHVALRMGSGDDAATVDVLYARGACFPMPAVLLDRPTVLTARTVSEAELLAVPAETLRALTSAEPALGVALLAATAELARSLMQQTADLKCRKAAQRLGGFLLMLAGEQGAAGSVRLPFGKRLLAAYLGMTPEHISRAFNTLRRHGVRTGHSRMVEITDRARLKLYVSLDDIPDEAASSPAAPATPRPLLHGNDLPRPA
jgi:CRP/FNR family transcriptional activator FtrB